MATVCKRSLSRVPAGARARAPHSSTGARRDAPRTMSATAPSSSSSNARNAYTNTLLRFAPASAKESKSHQSGAAAGGAMLPIVKGLSGSFGGIIEACCLQPVDVVKTRLQLDKTGQYKGVVDCFKKIHAQEGVGALWKGLNAFATHLCFKYMLRMGTNATFQAAMMDDEGKLTTSRRMAAGFGAGVVEALVVVTPFEVVKIRLQQQKGLENLKYKGTIHCARTIIKEEGLLAMWNGVGPTIARNGTNQMCLFTAKAQVDSLLWDKHDGDGKALHPLQSLVSGGLAATIGPVATGPFDVMKTRLMAQNKTGVIKYKSALHALYLIPKEEGILAMWKGLLPRLMRIPPGQAVTFCVADQIIQRYLAFEEQRKREEAP